MTESSSLISQLPLFQAVFYILTFSSFIWLITSLLALKRILTKLGNFRNFASINKEKDFIFPKLTIVIPAKNEEKYIRRCVDSLLTQNYPDFEILVINDNSSDMTMDILRSIKSDKLKVISVKALPAGWAGKAWACQVGFDNSEGDLILFTDADTNYFNKKALLNSVVEMEINSHSIVTGVPLLELNDFYSKMVMPLLNLFIDCFDGLSKTYPDKIIGSFFLVKREVLTSINGFNKVKSSFQEDSDIGIEIKKLDIKIKRLKLSNMVSAVWSRDYDTLKHGIRRIVAYDFQRKEKTFLSSCFLLFTSVLIPIFLAIYNCIVYLNNGNQMFYSFSVWNLVLCLIPIFGYLVVNRLKHKSQSLYCLLVFPASCFLLFSLITSMSRLVTKNPSKKEIVWKGVKYIVAK